uniref:Uncharacterized protein n=1 Tax=Lygus hesperus TaxID=30085 RepID=A0A146MBS6_LYGHE
MGEDNGNHTRKRPNVTHHFDFTGHAGKAKITTVAVAQSARERKIPFDHCQTQQYKRTSSALPRSVLTSTSFTRSHSSNILALQTRRPAAVASASVVNQTGKCDVRTKGTDTRESDKGASKSTTTSNRNNLNNVTSF